MFKSLFNTILAPTPDVIVSTELTFPAASNAGGGVVARLDSINDPKTYLLVWADRTYIYLESFVNGTRTRITTSAYTYSAGQKVELRVRGTEAVLYYNNVAISTAQTVPASAHTRHGYFSPHGGNTLGVLTVTAYPF